MAQRVQRGCCDSIWVVPKFHLTGLGARVYFQMVPPQARFHVILANQAQQTTQKCVACVSVYFTVQLKTQI